MRAGDKVVGAKGFEPSTSWSRTRRASQAALRPDISSIAIQLSRQRLQEYHSFRQAIDQFSTAQAMTFVKASSQICPYKTEMPPSLIPPSGISARRHIFRSYTAARIPSPAAESALANTFRIR